MLLGNSVGIRVGLKRLLVGAEDGTLLGNSVGINVGPFPIAEPNQKR